MDHHPSYGVCLSPCLCTFFTLDWTTHHPELHSSIHPQLLYLQKHRNIYTNIFLIILAEWMLCTLFPFGGSSPTWQYSCMSLQWLWAEAEFAQGKIEFPWFHIWASPKRWLDCWLECWLWLTRIFVLAMKQLVTITAEQPKEIESLTFFAAPTVGWIILWLEVL